MTTFSTAYGTATGNVIFNFPFTTWTVNQMPPDDAGTAGVREPRNPVIPPDCLVARKQPDGTWTVPAAITS